MEQRWLPCIRVDPLHGEPAQRALLMEAYICVRLTQFRDELVDQGMLHENDL